MTLVWIDESSVLKDILDYRLLLGGDDGPLAARLRLGSQGQLFKIWRAHRQNSRSGAFSAMQQRLVHALIGPVLCWNQFLTTKSMEHFAFLRTSICQMRREWEQHNIVALIRSRSVTWAADRTCGWVVARMCYDGTIWLAAEEILHDQLLRMHICNQYRGVSRPTKDLLVIKKSRPSLGEPN